MGKSLSKIVNWNQYNQALVSRSSLTFWVDEAAVKACYCHAHHGGHGRGFSYSDVAIETALMVKGIFNLTLRALEGFLNSLFTLISVSLKSPDNTSISKRAKTINIKYRNPSRGSIRHVVVDATGLKVFGEGKWKTHNHGSEKRRTCRKLRLAIDAHCSGQENLASALDTKSHIIYEHARLLYKSCNITHCESLLSILYARSIGCGKTSNYAHN